MGRSEHDIQDTHRARARHLLARVHPPAAHPPDRLRSGRRGHELLLELHLRLRHVLHDERHGRRRRHPGHAHAHRPPDRRRLRPPVRPPPGPHEDPVGTGPPLAVLVHLPPGHRYLHALQRAGGLVRVGPRRILLRAVPARRYLLLHGRQHRLQRPRRVDDDARADPGLHGVHPVHLHDPGDPRHQRHHPAPRQALRDGPGRVGGGRCPLRGRHRRPAAHLLLRRQGAQDLDEGGGAGRGRPGQAAGVAQDPWHRR